MFFFFIFFFYLDTDAKIGDTAPYSRNFAKLSFGVVCYAVQGSSLTFEYVDEIKCNN